MNNQKGNDVALRKRTQIRQANKTMFMWIAIASALVGIVAVVGFFLVQKLIFNEQVLAAKQATVSTLEKNNKAVKGLEDSIRMLDTNQALASAKANDEDQALRVVLDALPSEANSLALGASLQGRLLAGVPGLEIVSLQVDPILGVEVIADDTSEPVADGATNAIDFQFSVKGPQTALKQVLENLERSLRTIEVTAVRMEGTDSMFVSARAFYEPKKVVELYDKKVPEK